MEACAACPLLPFCLCRRSTYSPTLPLSPTVPSLRSTRSPRIEVGDREAIGQCRPFVLPRARALHQRCTAGKSRKCSAVRQAAGRQSGKQARSSRHVPPPTPTHVVDMHRVLHHDICKAIKSKVCSTPSHLKPPPPFPTSLAHTD